MNDLISKEQMRTILSSLKDYIDNNREENSINIKQTVIGSESDWLTEGNTTKTITLTNNINNYDYLVFVLEFRRGTNTSYENHTVLARVGYTNTISVDHSIGSDDRDGTYIIKVSIGASDTGAYIYQGARGSAYSGARIKEVVGIKFNALSTADIAEMAAPSSIYITLPTDGTTFNISAGDFIEVVFTSSNKDNKIYVAVREDAQSSWSNQYLFDHRVAEWETRQVVLLDGVSEGKLICYGTMSGILAVNYRYSIGHAKALGLI